MATPLPELQGGEGTGGGGAVAVLTNSVNSSCAKSFGGFFEKSEEKSPILIFLFFHKAVRNELEALHRLAMAFATGQGADLRSMLERCRFLRSIYKQHSNAEDEVKTNLISFLPVEMFKSRSNFKFPFSVSMFLFLLLTAVR